MTPPTVFALVAGLYWLVLNQPAAVLSSLSPEHQEIVRLGAGVCFWLCAAWAGKRLLAFALTHHAMRRRSRNSIPQLLIDIGGLALFFCAILIITSFVFDKPLGGLLATSGVFAAVVGFAVQRMISDVFAGIALNVEQGFKLGDWIETDGAIGQVTEVNWRATRLVTIDGRMIVLPNGILIGHQFVNLNAPYRHFRVRHEITLDYTAPVERALLILQTAMEAAAGVLKDPAPVVLVERCADSGVVYSLNYWAPDYPESFGITRRVIANALRFLDQAGYSPTYPKRDVTILDLAPRHIERGVDMGAILGRVPLFQRLGAEVLAQIRDAARLREVPPDTVVVTEGDAGASLFIIVVGLLSVTQKGAGREARRIAQLVPGDVFGEMSLLTGSLRSATVTTSTSVTLLEIGKAHFEPILAAHPEVVVKLSDLEAERLAANNAAFALWPDQRNEIATMGVAAFIRAKILKFFGSAEA